MVSANSLFCVLFLHFLILQFPQYGAVRVNAEIRYLNYLRFLIKHIINKKNRMYCYHVLFLHFQSSFCSSSLLFSSLLFSFFYSSSFCFILLYQSFSRNILVFVSQNTHIFHPLLLFHLPPPLPSLSFFSPTLQYLQCQLLHLQSKYLFLSHHTHQ